MKHNSDILSKDENHLSLIYDVHNGSNGIEVDKELPKYTSIKREVEEFKRKKTPYTTKIETTPSEMDVLTNDVVESIKEHEEVQKFAENFNLIKDSDIHDVNIFVNKYLFDDVFSAYNEYSSTIPFENLTPNDQSKIPVRIKWYEKVSELFRTSSTELDNVYAIDIIEFFSQIKGLTKQNVGLYSNRLAGYIVALKNSDMSGQKALKEKLIRDMVINKYESVLFANNMYYVVTEQQVVDFVKKTEKGVRLTYIKNYMGVIPPEVVAVITETNKMEVFDNYAILHYDPELKSYAETIKETKKRRDPILFGLIRGSNKLYYITDWIDEYCDLTLEKFVETLQISKEDLKMKETIV